MNDILTICANLLNNYDEADNATYKDIENVSVNKSQQYGLMHVYGFTYNGVQYYVSDDYSLNDDARLVENVIRDINNTLQGQLLKNPVPQSDGAIYAAGLDGVEYYLWKCSK